MNSGLFKIPLPEKKIPSEYEPFIPWLRTLPLFIELDSIRMVHAVWHFSSIELLRGKEVTDDDFVQETMQKRESIQECS